MFLEILLISKSVFLYLETRGTYIVSRFKLSFRKTVCFPNTVLRKRFPVVFVMN